MIEADRLEREKGHIRITALKAIQTRATGQSLVKVETDAGVVGIGEAGGPGPMTRGNLKYMEEVLLGQDPLDVERLHDTMMNYQHPNRSHIPTVSGVDIALWDIAGKVLGRPVSKLLRGQYRTEIPLYRNTRGPANWLDKAAAADWAAEIEAHPFGWKAIKTDFYCAYQTALTRDVRPIAKRSPTLMPSEIKLIAQGYENMREALDPSIDIIVHCHNEYDVPTMINVARAIAPIRPLWLEDPLPILYMESWKTLKAASPVPLSTGEKLEAPREFLAFMLNSAIDMLQPDLAFAGGFTGCWRIAELAEMFAIPLTTHNVGKVVQNAMTAHFAAATRNFVMTETCLGVEPMIEELIEEQLVVADGKLKVPTGPGLGITLNESAIRANKRPDEPYWD